MSVVAHFRAKVLFPRESGLDVLTTSFDFSRDEDEECDCSSRSLNGAE